MPAALASVLRLAPLTPEKVAFAWRTAVGAAVDRVTSVELRGSTLAVTVSVWLFDLHVTGPVWMLVLVAVADAFLGTALGLLVSAFARTEFQAVPFMPALVIPQILLCGLFIPRDQMPPVLETVSDVLPLSYAVDAMTSVTTTTSDAFGGVDPEVWADLGVVAAFALVALALGAATLRRRTA
jgi:ABC-2 type transport system permease protein